MKKTILRWSVRDLRDRFMAGAISFPEYQREPTVWMLPAKQRLVDSMVRQFDIAAFYFYEDPEGCFDCVDGRQRIMAIMSFMGNNDGFRDNGFPFKIGNEIYDDVDHVYQHLDGRTFAEVEGREEDDIADQFVQSFLDYQVTIVVLSESGGPSEFNLQFTRLNLGAIINSGEKLHAMVGDLRQLCFEDIGKHSFLQSISIPTRRYAREQLAAQILAQVFSMEKSGVHASDRFTRTRHIDLQLLFKRHTSLDEAHREWASKVNAVMDELGGAFDHPGVLRSRAVVLSTVLLAYELRDRQQLDAGDFAAFVADYVRRVREQVRKGLRFDREQAELLEFQKHVTQASVERPAVAKRAAMLKRGYSNWRERNVSQSETAE